eukprot:CAMPEP_0119563364 /NCGR_PEP_ID=MMETSP1352-20130426/23175_1 /TAXON_ID=265584 /ORGANISM="Stauroneis constricta, Strain CCMP1120" /LENGTH=138 /DNA_ID=CAMNT_0007611945 /DNA_START=1739 /DNA_END=2155 /DNA_ORIENTATION=+
MKRPQQQAQNNNVGRAVRRHHESSGNGSDRSLQGSVNHRNRNSSSNNSRNTTTLVDSLLRDPSFYSTPASGSGLGRTASPRNSVRPRTGTRRGTDFETLGAILDDTLKILNDDDFLLSAMSTSLDSRVPAPSFEGWRQ